ncbi:alkaline phytoceramidase [Westerdykella ornata]|uniref:Alkaline phytoceramidase n=1 Tax=Westerdykella ornata TaxID=318751 RepID=A0A6A6JMC3_WESOR|nr:alkaline phytoceramidase [Westerdykella ornata]KAF2276079.1 alkaline phytoceramidase [Westerdykella ornata]
MSVLGWKYREGPVEGIWGPPNSNHNFCEEDYIITEYIAEFVNTLTNLTYVIYGIHGLRRVSPKKDGGIFSTLALPYWGLIGVGVLSGWFHSTLKYHSQMGDDLSMFLAVGTLMHQLLTFNAPPAKRCNITLLILGTVIPISIYHVWADEIYAHQLAFVTMVFITGRKIRRLIRERVKNPESRKRLRALASMGSASGAFGYFLWSIDFHLCSYVTAVKRAVGLPLGLFLELHGWWHIFTGIGAYVGMALCEYLVTMEEGEKGRVEEGFVWPVKSVLMDVEGKERSKLQ